MTSTPARMLGTTLAAGSLMMALSACTGGDGDQAGATGGASPASSQPTASPSASTEQLTGRRTAIELTDRSERALTEAGIRWRAAAPARTTGDDEVRLPVTGGDISYDPLAGTVRTDGGLVAGKGDTKVRVTDVVVDLDEEVLTGEVGGERLTLATLDTSQHEVEHADDLVAEVDDIDVTFTESTVRALNLGLGTSLPTDGVTADLKLSLST